MIHRVLMVGLLAGLLAGLVVATLQHFVTTPLILQGEVYEKAESHDGMADMDEWKPADGIQRTAFTSRLVSGFPGVMAGPVSPPASTPSRESRNSPALSFPSALAATEWHL